MCSAGHGTVDKGKLTLSESFEVGKVGGGEGNDGRTRIGGKNGGDREIEREKEAKSNRTLCGFSVETGLCSVLEGGLVIPRPSLCALKSVIS